MKIQARLTNTVENVPPLTLPSVEGTKLDDYKIWGKSTQAGTPTPSAPIPISSVGDLVTDTSSEYYGKYKIPILSFDNRYWGKVDLGSLNWTRFYRIDDDTYAFVVNNFVGTHNAVNGKINVVPNMICQAYKTNASVNGLPSDDSVTMGCGAYLNKYLIIRDDSYSDAQSFKTAMSGVYLYYELATAPSPLVQPTETDIYLDAPLRGIGTAWDYIDFGRQKRVNNNAEISSYNGETVTTDYLSSTGSLTTGAQVVYNLTTPTEESISIPPILTQQENTILAVNTTISPNKMNVLYKSGAAANVVPTWGKVMTRTRNLFDINNPTISSNTQPSYYTPIISGGRIYSAGKLGNNRGESVVIPCKTGYTYTFSGLSGGERNGAIVLTTFNDLNSVHTGYLSNWYDGADSFSITGTADCDGYIGIAQFSSTVHGSYIDKLQIEEGSTATSYVPYIQRCQVQQPIQNINNNGGV